MMNRRGSKQREQLCGNLLSALVLRGPDLHRRRRRHTSISSHREELTAERSTLTLLLTVSPSFSLCSGSLGDTSLGPQASSLITVHSMLVSGLADLNHSSQ